MRVPAWRIYYRQLLPESVDEGGEVRVVNVVIGAIERVTRSTVVTHDGVVFEYDVLAGAAPCYSLEYC